MTMICPKCSGNMYKAITFTRVKIWRCPICKTAILRKENDDVV